MKGKVNQNIIAITLIILLIITAFILTKNAHAINIRSNVNSMDSQIVNLIQLPFDIDTLRARRIESWQGLFPIILLVIALSYFPNGLIGPDGITIEKIRILWDRFRKKIMSFE
jgi:hypothetical protein